MENSAHDGALSGSCHIFVRSSLALGLHSEGRNQVEDDASGIAGRAWRNCDSQPIHVDLWTGRYE